MTEVSVFHSIWGPRPHSPQLGSSLAHYDSIKMCKNKANSYSKEWITKPHDFFKLTQETSKLFCALGNGIRPLEVRNHLPQI